MSRKVKTGSYRIRLVITEPLLASLPTSFTDVKYWLQRRIEKFGEEAARRFERLRAEYERIANELLAKAEELVEEGEVQQGAAVLMFLRHPEYEGEDCAMIEDYHIRAMIEEAASALELTRRIRMIRFKVDVEPDHIPVLAGEDGDEPAPIKFPYVNPLVAITPYGRRQAVVVSEYIEPPCHVDFTLHAMGPLNDPASSYVADETAKDKPLVIYLLEYAGRFVGLMRARRHGSLGDARQADAPHCWRGEA